MVLAAAAAGCSSNPLADTPPTITPASAATSPPVTQTPAGRVVPLPGAANAALFDAATSTLVVLGGDSIVLSSGDEPRTIQLPGPATALTGDGQGVAYLSARGGYFRVELPIGQVAMTKVDGRDGTDFTAIALRGDGRLVLGSAEGTVCTLTSDTTVAAEVDGFARIDALVTQGNTAVVLDRAQTSVTTIDESGGSEEQSLRAGEGATTMAADPTGRILVVDTRGDELLVFGADPLIMRQRYPVRQAPYGLAATRSLAWVAQTDANVVIGYDLATGIPVEKMRYPTVRQPNSLAFDDMTGTLYVVSGTGDGIQVIAGAGNPT